MSAMVEIVAEENRERSRDIIGVITERFIAKGTLTYLPPVV